MSGLLKVLILGIVATLLAGCGGSSSGTPQGTVISVMFAGGTAPQAVATQTGGGAFTPAVLQAGNMLNFVLPTGTTKYAIAYVCPLFNDEFVFEATVQDGTVFTMSCPDFSTPILGAATGSVNASAIAGTTNVAIFGKAAGGSLSGVAGSFSVNLPVGTEDVALVAFDKTGSAAGVKIAASQTVPGAIGNVVFSPGDATAMQPATIRNVPAGFPSPGVFAKYHTANGSAFPLNTAISFNSPSPTYPAVPAAAVRNGDFYLYEATTLNISTLSELMGTTQTTTSGGGPVTMTLPAPWSYAGPAAAAFPTFTFNYSGFSGLPAVSQMATIAWPTGPRDRNLLTVTATANFQNGANTITIPDLTSLSGFFAPAPSGTTISWNADIFGGTEQDYIFSVNPPPNGSISFVETLGSYIQP